MWSALNLALSAVNMADVSGDTLRRDSVAEVYVLAATTVRFYLPTQLHFLAVSTHTLSLSTALSLQLSLRLCEVFSEITVTRFNTVAVLV